MNVSAGGVEGSLLEIIAFHADLEEAIKEGIVCCLLLLWAGLKDVTQPNVSREQRTCFCEWGGAFLLIRSRRESYQQKQMLSGFVRVCMHTLLLNVLSYLHM